MLKNIIFDCGGVIFDVNYGLSLSAFKRLATIPALFEKTDISTFKHIASDYEIGKQTTNEFYNDIRNKYKLNANDEQIKSAWNEMLLGFFPDSLNLIQNLKKHFKTALFTNTNELHFVEFEPECRTVLAEFDFLWYSHKIGFKKPNPDAFRYILKDSNFIPSETIFIDDSEENVIAASKEGIIPLHYDSSWNLKKLEEYLLHFND